MLEHPVDKLNVHLNGKHVGTLAETGEGLVAFQYSREWLESGYAISPRSLPLVDRVFVPTWQPFGGLFGAFNDSLPDGWGQLLLDRALREHGVEPDSVHAISRLAIVGSGGRGALEYAPQAGFSHEVQSLSLDDFARLSLAVFNDQEMDSLDAVYAAGGSSGGARPKVYYQSDGQEWLVKFPSRIDPPGIGQLEYSYMLCAQACGIEIPEIRLFPSVEHEGFFASKRFDREGDKHIHMLTASALLEVSHRVPALDYKSLFQLSYYLTGQRSEADQLFRRMCFNVFAHNHDDHSNNFTWLCRSGQWHLAPAYDLTYSTTYFGGHTTTVLGAANPSVDDVLALAKEVGIPARSAQRIASEIQEACIELLRSHGLKV